MVINCVEIKNLTLKFGDNIALNNLSVNIEKGKITGLIGADGSGKTTLIRTIIGILCGNSGEVTTLGYNAATQKEQINSKIGYMPQKFGLYEDLTIDENLNLYADLKGIKESQKERIFDELLTMTGLNAFRTRFAGKLSGGMKQKLGLCCALLGKPEFLLLDEPSVGVDPISRRELLHLVKNSTDTTVLWSTAYIDEAQGFDSTIVLDKGKIIFNDKPGELAQTTQGFEDKVIELMGGFHQTHSNIADKIDLTSLRVDCPVKADALVKKYGDFYAVKKNSFCINRGEIFGLLGPNGAGKSTTFKMMCGLSSPTSGNAEIMGVDIKKNPTKARSYLGYMAQKFSLYSNLSVIENLRFFSGIYGLKFKERRERIDEMTELFGFQKYLKSLSGELSLGYKQRLSLACAIMHNPPVLFLDEPTSGVDPVTRREFWLHIKTLAAKGVTVLITTHFMDEAEFCNRISLFYKGESVASGTPDELKTLAGSTSMENAFIELIKRSESEDE